MDTFRSQPDRADLVTSAPPAHPHPARAHVGADVRRMHAADPGSREPAVELVPRAPAPELRVVGPGRRERGYLRQIAELAADLRELDAAQHAAARELEVARLVERGTARWMDRLERELTTNRQQANRLLVALGASERENARLQEELAAARARIECLTPPEPAPRRPLWRVLLGRP